MKKFLDKNNIVLASLMLLLPLSAEAHLPLSVHGQALSADTQLSSASGVQGFDACIPGEKMTLQQCFELADKQNLALQTGR